jgi:hypothetical protein
MRRRNVHRRVRDAMDRIKRWFRREPESPDDPYALVGAPKKQRLPHRSASAAAPLE